MSHFIRTLRCSAWLAWQIESNWVNPWLFAVYVLVKPLTASLLLVCMYWAAQQATAGGVSSGFLPFMYVSNACYMLVAGVTFGMSSAVVTDRENYGMLKFIRISPVHLQNYLLGRGLSRAAQAALGVVLSLALGWVLLPELRTAWARHPGAWGWLVVYLAEGTVMLVALGMFLAGTVLNLPRHGMFLSEGVAGLLYLLSGAVFPITVLPGWLRPVSLALPPTYWLEGMRRALLGPSEVPSPLAGWGHGQLALALLLSTAALVTVAHFFFRWSERRAWRVGNFDKATGY